MGDRVRIAEDALGRVEGDVAGGLLDPRFGQREGGREIRVAAGLGVRGGRREGFDRRGWRSARSRRAPADRGQAQQQPRNGGDAQPVADPSSVGLGWRSSPRHRLVGALRSCWPWPCLPCRRWHFLALALLALRPGASCTLPIGVPAMVATPGAAAASVPGPWHSSDALHGTGGGDVGEAAEGAGVVDLHPAAVFVFGARACRG